MRTSKFMLIALLALALGALDATSRVAPEATRAKKLHWVPAGIFGGSWIGKGLISLTLSWWFLIGTGSYLDRWTVSTSGPYQTREAALHAQAWILEFYKLPTTSAPPWLSIPYDDAAFPPCPECIAPQQSPLIK